MAEGAYEFVYDKEGKRYIVDREGVRRRAPRFQELGYDDASPIQLVNRMLKFSSGAKKDEKQFVDDRQSPQRQIVRDESMRQISERRLPREEIQRQLVRDEPMQEIEIPIDQDEIFVPVRKQPPRTVKRLQPANVEQVIDIPVGRQRTKSSFAVSRAATVRKAPAQQMDKSKYKFSGSYGCIFEEPFHCSTNTHLNQKYSGKDAEGKPLYYMKFTEAVDAEVEKQAGRFLRAIDPTFTYFLPLMGDESTGETESCEVYKVDETLEITPDFREISPATDCEPGGKIIYSMEQLGNMNDFTLSHIAKSLGLKSTRRAGFIKDILTAQMSPPKCTVYNKVIQSASCRGKPTPRFEGLFIKYGGMIFSKRYPSNAPELTHGIAILYHLLTGVKMMVERNIVHLDVAERNILFTETSPPLARFIDFGRSVYPGSQLNLLQRIESVGFNSNEYPWWVKILSTARGWGVNASTISIFNDPTYSPIFRAHGFTENKVPKRIDGLRSAISRNVSKIDCYAVVAFFIRNAVKDKEFVLDSGLTEMFKGVRNPDPDLAWSVQQAEQFMRVTYGF